MAVVIALLVGVIGSFAQAAPREGAAGALTLDRILVSVDLPALTLKVKDRKNVETTVRLARPDILVLTEERTPGELKQLQPDKSIKLVMVPTAAGDVVAAVLMPSPGASFIQSLPLRQNAEVKAVNAERGTVGIRDPLGRRFNFTGCQKVVVVGADGRLASLDRLEVGQRVDIVWVEMRDQTLRPVYFVIR